MFMKRIVAVMLTMLMIFQFALAGNVFVLAAVPTPTKADLQPKGYLDYPKNNQTICGNYKVSGWFLDVNGVRKVEVLVDSVVKGTAVYGDLRSDVMKVYPEYNNKNAGFHYNLDTKTLKNGSHKITVRATGKSGSKLTLNSKTVIVYNEESTPVKDRHYEDKEEFEFDTDTGMIIAYNGSSVVVEIPSEIRGIKVTGIGANVFKDSDIVSVTIPDSVTVIREKVFSGCTELINVYLPKGLTTLGEEAFLGCSALKSITIPTGVTCIFDGTFKNCTGLTGLTIPKEVTYIGSFAFSGCTGLKSLVFEGTLCLSDHAFCGCSGLTSIVFAEGETKIGYCAFNNCTSLTEIVIPKGLTSLGDCAFMGCSQLSNAIFLGDQPYVRNDVFKNTKSELKKTLCCSIISL